MSFRRRVEPTRRVAVIGAGIAGLSTAYYLGKYGFDVRMFEREEHAGGIIRSSWREDKYLLEHGPNTYFSSSEHLARLSRELSLDQAEIRTISRERFVYWNGALRPLPQGPATIAATKLLSALGKMRLLAEPLVRSRSPEGETLAQFTRRRAGREVLRVLVDPFVSGMWAGNPEELELRSVLPKLYELEKKYGSIVCAAAKERDPLSAYDMISYQWGMETLPARLEEVLKQKIKLGTSVDSVVRNEAGRLFVVAGNPRRRLEADAVVIATGPHSAATMLESMLPRAASALKEIRSCPLAVVHTAYKKSSFGVSPRGFGMLIPRAANVRLLGSIFSSSMFENRAPSDEVLLTNFIGGVHDPDVLALSDAEIITEVRKSLHLTMGVNAKPEYVKVTRLERAIPQYTVGHAGRVEEIEKDLSSFSGIFLTGNYLRGTSVSDTIGHTRRVADAVRVVLSRPRVRTISREHS